MFSFEDLKRALCLAYFTHSVWLYLCVATAPLAMYTIVELLVFIISMVLVLFFVFPQIFHIIFYNG